MNSRLVIILEPKTGDKRVELSYFTGHEELFVEWGESEQSRVITLNELETILRDKDAQKALASEAIMEDNRSLLRRVENLNMLREQLMSPDSYA